MKTLPVVVLIAISCFDIARHRIPHLLLFLLTFAYLIIVFDFDLRPFLSLVAILSLLALSTDIGMGDIKLLLVLGIFVGRDLISIRYLSLLWMIATITLMSSIAIRGRVKGNIPLAPAISLPLVLLHLGF